MRLFFLLAVASILSCSPTQNLEQTKGINLLEAYSNLSVGGKEAEDGMNTIKHFSFVFEPNADLEFEKIWIHGQAYGFESFEYENKLFLVVKSFPKNNENKIFEQMPYSSDVAALIQYKFKDGKSQFLEVKEIKQREATLGN